MPDASVSPVVQRFSEWRKSKGYSDAEAAKLLSISPSALSQVFSGKYKGNVRRIEDKMERALEHSDRRSQRPKKPEIVETSVYQRVTAALRTAHDESCMAVIVGPSQVGKTSAATDFCKSEPDTIYVCLHPNGHNGRQRSSRPLLKKLAEALHIGLTENAANDEWIEEVASRLKGSDRMVIIDQADLADENILQCLRTIWDLAQIGMALVGTPDFLAAIRRKNSSTLNQVLRRIAYCEIVDGLTEDDAEKMLEKFRLDETSVAAAHAGAHGIAGRLALGIVGAQRLAKETGKPVDRKLIDRAFSKLMEV
jgi:DNA transposition AAA+ family ATPase